MTGDSERSELLSADRAARLLAQEEFERPVILEAGAGTGKTTTLVARVLSWGLGPGWESAAGELLAREPELPPDPDRIAVAVLEGIVSITFTEAAAAEMETRIAQALARVAAGEAAEIVGFLAATDPRSVEPELRERAQALLAGLDHLTVRTIHAYCLNLLKRYPLEAGLHPELTVDADGAILEELVGEVVETELRSAYQVTGESSLIHLARHGIGPRQIAVALRLLAERGFSSVHLRENPFGPERVAKLVRRLRTPLESLEELLDGRFDRLPASQNAPKVAAAAAATLAQLAHIESTAEPGVEAAVAVCQAAQTLWTDRLVEDHLRKWKLERFTKGEEDALAGDGPRLRPIADQLRRTLRQLRQLDPRFLDHARQALVDLLSEIESEMKARGVITFSGLLQATRDLLTDHAGVRRRERGRLRQLLVDEFQDTDRLQCDLVRRLALSGPPDRRPGLFVVGDPKQSIYGWRNADLEAYEEFLAAVAKAGGHRHSLVENFRSAAPILAEVDRAIAPTMVRLAGLQPGYEPLLASAALADSPGFDRADRAPVELWVSWRPAGGEGPGEARTPVDDAARIEAEAVARDIADLVRKGESKWSDFAVLLRSGNRLDLFLTAFRDAGVPFAVNRDKSYFQRREVIEAAALVRAVVNPVDHLALLTYLRSPSVGVPDAALIPLWVRHFPDLMSNLTGPSKEAYKELRGIVDAVALATPSDTPGIEAIRGWEKSLLSGAETLLWLRASFADDPPDRFIEHIRTWLLLEATESARYLGSFRVANLERFLRQLEAALERSGGDIQAVLRALRRSVAEAREAEEAVPKEAALEAVQILTIHAAKGLEFKHVYLAQLHAESRGDDDHQIDTDERWTPGEKLEYRLFGSPTPNFDRVTARRRRVEDAERVRLLYVAMTRARERLVLIGRWPERPTPVPEAQRKSFLDLLGSRRSLPESILELAPTGAKRDGRERTAEALWRFPGYDPAAESGRRRVRTAEWLPTPDRVRASSEHLRRRAEAAEARMARPFHEAATRESGQRLEITMALEPGQRRAAGGASREAAMQVGTAVHRLFETWDLAAEPESELERQRQGVAAFLRASLAEDLRDEAVERARQLLDRVQSGELLARFLRLRERIVARELPVTLPPPAHDSGPVGFLSGAVDLLYRDDAGEIVIVDFKTDALELELEIETRASEYASQERIYQQAIRSALDLGRLPAVEIWFLWPDRLHRFETETSA